MLFMKLSPNKPKRVKSQLPPLKDLQPDAKQLPASRSRTWFSWIKCKLFLIFCAYHLRQNTFT